MSEEILQLTPAEQFRSGDLVRLPSERVIRIRPLPLTALLTAGVIPNKLLAIAEKYSAGSTKTDLRDNEITQFFELMNFVVQVAVVEPRLIPISRPKVVSDDLREVLNPEIPEGCITHFDLTDADRMFIFDYAQRGPAALKPFREEPDNGEEAVSDGDSVRAKTEQPDGDQ